MSSRVVGALARRVRGPVVEVVIEVLVEVLVFEVRMEANR